MSLAVTLPNPDLAMQLQQAVAALAKIIEAKPESDHLLSEMVRISGEAIKAGGAAVWVTEQPERAELVLEHQLAAIQLMQGETVITGVMTAVRRCAREAKPLIVPAFFLEPDAVDSPQNPSPFELLYIPMKLHGKVAMVLMMAVPPPPPSVNDLHRTYLNFLIRMVGAAEQSLAERHLQLMEKDRGTSNKLVRFAEQVHKHLFVAQVAIDISNLARDVMEADRVTVELHPRMRKKVVAVSNVDEPNKRAHMFQVQRLIFDYVRDRQAPVILDREAAKQLMSDPSLQDAASAYFEATEFNAFLAAPIKSDDPASPVLGVLVAEYATTEKAQAHVNLLTDVTRLCATSVANAADIESVPFLKTFHAIRALWRQPAGTKRTMTLSIAGGIVVLLAIVAVFPFDFSIKADCQIRPSSQLSIVAPMEERLIDVPVRANDRVYTKDERTQNGEPAQPLARFDPTNLIQQRAEAMGKMGEVETELRDAQHKGDLPKIAVAQSELDEATQQIKLLDHEIDQCTVWSPIEGTVLTENVEQKRWSTPKKGEPLMDIASFSDWELVVDVPESEVAAVRGALEKATRTGIADGRPDQGIEIEYILRPWQDQKFEVHAKGIATLLPASQQTNNANVFRLLVKLDRASLPDDLRMSGITGRAKIHLGKKALATQWLRGPMRLLRMTLFF